MQEDDTLTTALSPAPAVRAEEMRVTPMMAQYTEIKAANPGCLLFYRMGDFYELFFGDAEIASRALGIVLTKRGKHLGDDIPMCGVPIDRAEEYLHRLIALGHRVAVCEQTEDPADARKRGAKSVVQRDVVRVVTPGTITEDRLLEPGRANCLSAVTRVKTGETRFVFGLATADISTGAFALGTVEPRDLAAEIARVEPRELVIDDALSGDPDFAGVADGSRSAKTWLRRDGDELGERRLRDWFGLATVDGLGAFSRAERAAAGLLLAYLERTQVAARPALAFPARAEHSAILAIDAATRANLELTRTLSGERDGSLLATIDRTVTSAGGRLLADRLAAPLTDAAAISQRHDAVAFLVAAEQTCGQLRAALAGVPDMARALSRLGLDRGGPRDLACVRDGLTAARELTEQLRREPDLPAELATACDQAAAVSADVAAALSAGLSDELPLKSRDGHFVRRGVSADLDEQRTLRDETRHVIAALQARYAETTSLKALRVKHNNVLGYFVEVPQAAGERLLAAPFSPDFVHRQTMAGTMRFSTAELSGLEARIAAASESALAMELALFARWVSLTLEHGDAIKAAAEALAVMDVTAALADLAVARDWVRPSVDTSQRFFIEGGRHPVVEAALRAEGNAFMANDCDLSSPDGDAGRIVLLTGPNMAGKSTFLRQNALTVVLAQMGSFVPARRATIGIVDRLFSRVGAADDLARGRSTFMVEMVETAAILNQATARSLVILDEIGRGTATFDGLSIAWATLEHLHDINRSRALFATHFHELTLLAKKLKRLTNLTMRVTEWAGDVVFLHEVVAGAADRSYGIQVAKLAGLPRTVVARARKLLAEMEASDRQAPVAKLIDDLPLFAALKPIEAAQPDPVATALEAIDPDDLSPREALEALYTLKRAARTGSDR